MRRQHRSNVGAPVSLFSFQDIMTSVMGVLIFVTLIMSLELATTVSGQISRKSTPPPSETMPDVAKLRQSETVLRQQYEKAMKDLRALAQASGDQTPRLQQSRSRLLMTYEQIEELETKVQNTRKGLEKLPAIYKQRQAQLDELVLLEQQVTQLRDQIRRETQNPRLTYIVQAGNPKSPILIELSSQRVGIGSIHESEPVIWLKAGDLTLFSTQLAAFAASRAPSKEYFLLLVKPSAIGEVYDGAREILKGRGFDVGTDLLLESEAVLYGSR